MALLSDDARRKLKTDLANQFGGVYLLFDGKECVYVGESENVPERLNTHIREGWKVFDSFRVYFCDNRKEVESTLIRTLYPKYNDQENPYPIKGAKDLLFSEEHFKYFTDKVDDFVSTVIRQHNPVWVESRVVNDIFRDYNPWIYRPVLEKYNAVREIRWRGSNERQYDIGLISSILPVLFREIEEANIEWRKQHPIDGPYQGFGELLNNQ